MPFNRAPRFPSATFDSAEIPPTSTSRASIVPVNVGCVSRYFPASAPPSVYPPTVTGLPTPAVALWKLASGTPPTLTPSPASTPTSVGVPTSVAAVVPSYTRLATVSP